MTAQEALLPVLGHLGRALGTPASWHHRELRNPLTPGAAYPLLRLSPAAALALQVWLCVCSAARHAQPSTRPWRQLAMKFAPAETGLLTGREVIDGKTVLLGVACLHHAPP